MNDSEGQLNGNDLAKHVKTSLSLKTLGRNLGLMGSDESFMQKGVNACFSSFVQVDRQVT